MLAEQRDSAFDSPLEALTLSAVRTGKAWSGSNLGYHALVYYFDFEVPHPGCHFDKEWGLMGKFQGSTGVWKECMNDDVVAYIRSNAGDPDISSQRQQADAARRAFADMWDDSESILKTLLGRSDDEYLAQVHEESRALTCFSYEDAVKAQMPSGPQASRDTAAISQGLRSAPHQQVIADVMAIRSPFLVAGQLSELCRKAARHLQRNAAVSATHGDHIFIGHGRSLQWMLLKEYITDRLHLQCDEFNRVSVAGVSTTDRLQEMVDSSAMAFLVATAEDERLDGTMSARENVVHEIGLFQGKLGFGRAIVLLEEGCSEFSNILGLGQIRFPKGNIKACFEEVREVLEREDLLPPTGS